MEYITKIIDSPAKLGTCPVFSIDHFQWTCLQKPTTYGRMGYIPGMGFYSRIICHEQNPRREYLHHQDPVCKDSAVEIFLALPNASPNPSAPGASASPSPSSVPSPASAPSPIPSPIPSNDGLYLNFEINANGAMYAKYGYGRSGRQFFTPEEYAQTGVRSEIWPEFWSVDIMLPLSLISRVSGIKEFSPGDIIYCNFYKISEDPTIEHYAAFSPIHNLTPNFHLPQYFAKGVISL